ncbi:CRISPR-associated protein Cas5 [Streptomyces sp. NPDC093109]|uniref:CRISPR-associated protein Cas5 n=1 Tax=Streptomyces sp. NPDC093109 TaxID=3154977 RepID=UPI00344E2694
MSNVSRSASVNRAVSPSTSKPSALALALASGFGSGSGSANASNASSSSRPAMTSWTDSTRSASRDTGPVPTPSADR